MKFIIYAPEYNPDSGGSSVLYALAGLLNDLGHEASIWPDYKPYKKSWNFVWLLLRRTLTFQFGKLYRIFFWKKNNLPFNLKYADTADLSSAVVIYPEITTGNPLKSKKVVRWLLNKPGVLTKFMPRYGDKDLFFYYLEVFNDPTINKFEYKLQLNWVHKKYYSQENFGQRTGSAYLVRKGSNRILDRHPPDAILVDGMSHQELNKVFNRVEYLYSYDLYTAYNYFAAYCGCKVVVIPDQDLTLENWQPASKDRDGIAYGVTDLSRACKTRSGLIDYFDQLEREERESVSAFVSITEAYFSEVPQGAS